MHGGSSESKTGPIRSRLTDMLSHTRHQFTASASWEHPRLERFGNCCRIASQRVPVGNWPLLPGDHQIVHIRPTKYKYKYGLQSLYKPVELHSLPATVLCTVLSNSALHTVFLIVPPQLRITESVTAFKTRRTLIRGWHWIWYIAWDQSLGAAMVGDVFASAVAVATLLVSPRKERWLGRSSDSSV